MIRFKIVQLVQGTDQWLEYRRNGLGASEYPAVSGVDGAYQTREEVIRSKLGLETKKLSDFTKKAFDTGHRIEQEVRQDLNTKEGFDFVPVVCEYVPIPRMFASLDGYDVSKGIILEVKSTSSKDIIAQIQNGFVPAIYESQIQYQLFVTGMLSAKLVVVNVNTGDRYNFSVSADTSKFAEIEATAQEFFADLDTRKLVMTQIQHDTDAQRLEQVTQVIKDFEEKIKVLEDEKKYLADALLRKYNAYTLSSPRMTIEYCQRQGTVDYKSIPELAGIDLEKYRKKPSSYIKVTLAKGN